MSTWIFYLVLTGPSSTLASSTIVGPPEDDDDGDDDDVDGATEDRGPPTAVILMRMENLASIAYMMPVPSGISSGREIERRDGSSHPHTAAPHHSKTKARDGPTSDLVVLERRHSYGGLPAKGCVRVSEARLDDRPNQLLPPLNQSFNCTCFGIGVEIDDRAVLEEDVRSSPVRLAVVVHVEVKGAVLENATQEVCRKP